MSYVEEQTLKVAALDYARAAFQPAETRARVDRALSVLRLLAEKGDDTDRTLFRRDELSAAAELAAMTLLHACERGSGDQDWIAKPPERTKMEELVELVRKEVRSVRGHYGHPSQLESVVFAAFDRIAALVAQGGCTRPLGNQEPCDRYGTCPVHGKNRPGQCVPVGEQAAAGSKQQAPDSNEEPLTIPAATHICMQCDKVFHRPFRCCGQAADVIREDLGESAEVFSTLGERFVPDREAFDRTADRFDPEKPF